jgi:outer membrane immunogenic protein
MLMNMFWLRMLALFACVGSGPAMAADIPVKAPPRVVDPPWNWSGFYLGGNAGYSWGRSSTDIDIICAGVGVGGVCPVVGQTAYSANHKLNLNGPLGGVQAGFNLQNGQWVFGIEADIQWTGQKGSTGFACPAQLCNSGDVGPALQIVSGTLEQKLTWFGTLRGRLGIAHSTWLAYVTGGLAYGELKSAGTLAGITTAGPATSLVFSNRDRNLGWTAGGGIEAALGRSKWSAKLEYLYIDLGRFEQTVAFTTTAPPVNVRFDSRVTDHILRVGLNYRFGDDPVVAARY